MTIEQFERALGKRQEQDTNTHIERYNQISCLYDRIRTIDEQIRDFMRLGRQRDEYQDRESRGIHINLGPLTKWEGLPDLAADFLGRKEPTRDSDQAHIQAFIKKGAHLTITVGAPGIGRHIDVHTSDSWWSSPDIRIDFVLGKQLFEEPQSVSTAFDTWKREIESKRNPNWGTTGNGDWQWLLKETDMCESVLRFALKRATAVVSHPSNVRH